MKDKIRSFLSTLNNDVDGKEIARFLLWFFSGLITLYTVILLSGPLYKTASTKGLTFALDNDGGRAIETSMATRWYNSNHFAPYGNTYYRFSQTLADLIPFEKLSSELETRERSHSFTLKLVSLFSLFTLGILVCATQIGFTPATLVFGSLTVLISLRSLMWSEWVYRPHPEHLLVLATVAAFYLFARFLKDPADRKKFIYSALAWGLAMSVKRSTAAFVPGIILFVFLYDRRKVLPYIGYMLLSYLVIGFPQNFGFVKHIKFLTFESSLHSFGGIDTISTGLKLIWNQLPFIIPALFLALISDRREKALTWKLPVFLVISLLPVLLRKLSFPGDHHTMAFAGCVAITGLIALNHMVPFSFNKQWVLVPLGLLAIKLHGIPDQYYNWQSNQLSCVPQMQEINSLAEKDLSSEFRMVREPFFPSSATIEKETSVHWGITLDDITDKTGFIGLNTSSYKEYHDKPASYFFGVRVLNWDKKVEFYRTLVGKTEFTHKGMKFKRIYEACSFELWKRDV